MPEEMKITNELKTALVSVYKRGLMQGFKNAMLAMENYVDTLIDDKSINTWAEEVIRLTDKEIQ